MRFMSGIIMILAIFLLGIIGCGDIGMPDATTTTTTTASSSTTSTTTTSTTTTTNISGNPDLTFGVNGKVVYDGGENEHGRSIAIQSSDKILVTGYGAARGFSKIITWRYHSNGATDETFGPNLDGKTAYPGGAGNEGNSMAFDYFDKILLTGHSSVDSTKGMIIIRYDLNGNPDTTFGPDLDGKAIDPGSSDFGRAITTEASGKIYVTGYTWEGSNNDMVLWAYNSNGSPETAFGSGGKVIYNAGFDDFGNAIAIDSDKIIVAGNTYDYTNGNMIIWRFNSNGSPDATFGSGGKVIYDGGHNDWAGSIAMVSGKILVAGMSNNGYANNMAIWRYHSDGSLDAAFGSGGKAIYDSGTRESWGNSIAVDSADRILVAGIHSDGSKNRMAIWRYSSEGSPDLTFGSSGEVIYSGRNDSAGYSLAVDSSDRILVTGDIYNGSDMDMVIWRYK